MPTPPTTDLAERLAAADRPLEVPPMPRVGWRVRLSTSRRLHRALPLRLVIRRAELHGRRTWTADPEERERALAAIEAIVGGTERAGEVEALARRQLVENETHKALFWRRWDVNLAPDAAARLRQALDSGRGVLASPSHLGPMFVLMSAVDAMGRVPYTVAGDWFFQAPTPNYWGRRLAYWRGERREHRVIPAGGSFEIVQALLERGELVQVFFDLPGSRETTFLGKPVMLATGTARLALRSHALVLPMRARREGHRMWTDVHAPLDPHDFASVEQLHEALAAIHERWILELPATLEDPRRPGAWEQCATGSAWRRPERQLSLR